MTKRYIDPHVDPMRAPSRAGHHPHLVSQRSAQKNPQHMFEQRGAMNQYRPMQQGHMGQAQQPPPSDFWKLAGIFGLGALAVYLGYKAAQGEEGPRRNPEEPSAAPVQPAPAQLVVMPGPVPSLPMQTLQGLPCPPETMLTPAAVQDGASASLAAAADILKKREAEVPQPLAKPAKKKRGPRTRMTSQARTPEGKYLPAGTRKRRVREGSKEMKK